MGSRDRAPPGRCGRRHRAPPPSYPSPGEPSRDIGLEELTEIHAIAHTLRRISPDAFAPSLYSFFFEWLPLVFAGQIVSSLHATGDDQGLLRSDQSGQLLQS